MIFTCDDEHGFRRNSSLFGQFFRMDEIFARRPRLRLLHDALRRDALSAQIRLHDGCLRLRLVRALPAGHDHARRRMRLQIAHREIEPLAQRAARPVAVRLRPEDDHKRHILLRRIIPPVEGDEAHHPEHERHSERREAPQHPPPAFALLAAQEMACQQHRSEQQQTDARHPDVPRRQQTPDPKRRANRGQPQNTHPSPSSARLSSSHCSISCESCVSAPAFSAISRASS